MCNYRPTILVWLKQTNSTAQARRTQDDLAGQRGVLAVHTSRRAPHLMLVKYDADQTSSQKLLHAARSRDHAARLIGI